MCGEGDRKNLPSFGWEGERGMRIWAGRRESKISTEREREREREKASVQRCRDILEMFIR